MVQEKHKELLIKIIVSYEPHCAIYLFGSRAQGRARAGSDIDLALDAGKKIDWRVLNNIRDDIEESVIPFFVDVVDLHNVDDAFRKEIEKDLIAWNK